eukprot:CAMPEP_0172811122 /NCGR_PEP_ID=MMETSP1075-20121228/9219_1 /TAXON_ID=2916 /ORGANISM="Ceratium fusus, Strain PA161109" /LENGTH=184 /DNA_ID=CAMNT_0013650513 /DNA_START=28 /DNA_END=582 /DNA_ORIENTATION=-
MAAAAPASHPPTRRVVKKKMSWSLDVQGHDAVQSLTETPEPQLISFGMIRAGSVYELLLPLPTVSTPLEVVPFLSTQLVAEIIPGSGDIQSSLRLNLTSTQPGRFARNISLQASHAAGGTGEPDAQGLCIRVEACVVGTEQGKPMPRHGVVLICGPASEDTTTLAPSEWEFSRKSDGGIEEGER